MAIRQVPKRNTYKIPYWFSVPLCITFSLVITFGVVIPKIEREQLESQVHGWCLPPGTTACKREYFTAHNGDKVEYSSPDACGTLSIPSQYPFEAHGGAEVTASAIGKFVKSCNIIVTVAE